MLFFLKKKIQFANHYFGMESSKWIRNFIVFLGATYTSKLGVFYFFKGKGVLILNCHSQACILEESTKKIDGVPKDLRIFCILHLGIQFCTCNACIIIEYIKKTFNI
jgi:hypothetical protein